MRRARLPLLWAFLLAGWTGSATAGDWSLRAARVGAPGVEAQRLRLDIRSGEGGAALELGIAALAIPGLAFAGPLHAACALSATPGGGLACEGPVRVADHPALALRARLEEGMVELVLSDGRAHARLALPLQGPGPTRLHAQRVPLALATPLLAARSPLALQAGELDFDGERSAAGAIHGHWALRGLALAAPGLLLSELHAAGRLAFENSAGLPRLGLEAVLDRGHLQYASGELALPPRPVHVAVQAAQDLAGRWQLDGLRWRDGRVLDLAGALELDPAAPGLLGSWQLQRAELQFPAVLDSYGRALPFTLPEGLQLQGSLAASARGRGLALADIQLEPAGLDVHLDQPGIALEGLVGTLDWAPAGLRPPARFGWQALTVEGIALGAASARWQASEGALQLLDPLAMAGGRLVLERSRIDPDAAAPVPLQTGFRVAGLELSNPAGTLAVAGLSADGELALHAPLAEPGITAGMTLRGGEALAGAFYLQLPHEPVEARLDARRHPDGQWQLAQALWNDPGALQLEADGVLAADGLPRSLDLGIAVFDLRQVQQRYGQSLLAQAGFADVETGGRLEGRLVIREGDLAAVRATLDEVRLDDPQRRLGAAGLGGRLDWAESGERPQTALHWTSLQVLGVPLEAARAHLQSLDGRLVLTEPLAIPVLGGELRLRELALHPREARGRRHQASLALAGLDMHQVSQALGWPAFPGNLSGGIPEITLEGDVLELGGGLDLWAFDGHAQVSDLRLERVFGPAPSLAASVHFQRMDLEQVTSAFSLGAITGRLSGAIRQLRLVDWSPVQFDAWMATRGGGRMSYNAVSDVASIGGGGGGLVAGVQGLALQWFGSFGYSALGLRCRLHEQVCLMGGIDPVPPVVAAGGPDPTGGQYTVAEGAGLPRIRIVGHHRQVDWPTLVQRLVDATRGEGPLIQ